MTDQFDPNLVLTVLVEAMKRHSTDYTLKIEIPSATWISICHQKVKYTEASDLHPSQMELSAPHPNAGECPHPFNSLRPSDAYLHQ